VTPRERSIAWAAKFAADPRAAICDTETTGKDGDAEIVDIALIRMDGTIVVNSLVRSLVAIPAESSRIHGITENQIGEARAPRWAVLWPLISYHFQNHRISAWNAPFDLGRLNYACHRDGFGLIASTWDDPMQHYGAFQGTVGKFGGFKWWRLDLACHHLGITPGGHRALADAEATRLVILAMAGVAAPKSEAVPEQAALRFG
jgi:DNA polymerase-3 subunit epsilon